MFAQRDYALLIATFSGISDIGFDWNSDMCLTTLLVWNFIIVEYFPNCRKLISPYLLNLLLADWYHIFRYTIANSFLRGKYLYTVRTYVHCLLFLSYEWTRCTLYNDKLFPYDFPPPFLILPFLPPSRTSTTPQFFSQQTLVKTINFTRK